MEITVKEACNGYWQCFSTSEYIQVIAVSIAMIAAIASWFSIYTQSRLDKKNKEPIIVPGIKNIETKIDHIMDDWDQTGSIPKKFSNTTLPIWNYGNTPVFNVSYSYSIENFDYFLEKENLEKKYSDYKLKALNKEEGKYTLSLQYTHKEKPNQVITGTDIVPYIRSVDVIRPNSNNVIKLPDYFLILLNNYFLDSLFEDKKMPILLLNLYYDDINFTTWRQQFRVFIPNTYQFKGETLTTLFHYEVVQKKRKVKMPTIKENEKRIKKRQEKEEKKNK
ncbi:hypothetical protein [Paraliobacillus sediminis]|uniref:hypothetical protein n=1 Tax=Paraliobacillus sediminis TaxID=1885916 RepID=UPI000E3D8C5B|nr:hypothetical protein [Paraliobacillus sediminis]